MGQSIYDGNVSFLGGQNAGLSPSLLNPTQFALGVNLSLKNGSIRSRPGYTQNRNGKTNIKILTEGGITSEDGTARSYATIYKTGKFQGAGQFISDQGKFIIAVISGIIFRIDPAKAVGIVLTVEDEDTPPDALEPPTQRLNQYTDRHYMTEAGRFFVIYDYPDYAVVIDGVEARRVNPAKYEIPVAAVFGVYNQNRLQVFSAAHEFIAGDPVGNPATPDAPITFEEVFAPAAAFAGQSFSLGSTNLNNPITAAGYLEAVDSSTGIGPMFVATSKEVYAFQTQLPRNQWEQTTFGIKVISTSGIAGQRSHVNVGSDLWFMGGDGRIRSFSVARGDQIKWARTPLDKEVENWIRFCDKSLIQYTVAAYHNNRILFSVNPQVTTAKNLNGKSVSDISFKGMVALELDPVSGFLQNSSPSWAGLWTGINPMEMINLDNDLYVFSKDPGSVNVLYKVEQDDITWDTYEGKRKQIVSMIDTRSYTFAQEGVMYALKEEVTVFPALKEIGGKFCLEVFRRNDDYPNYKKWSAFLHSAPIETCTIEENKIIPNLVPHSFREVNFGDAEESNACNPVSDEQIRYFNETQFRLILSGLSWELTAFRVKAELQEDDGLITDQLMCEDKNVKLEKTCELHAPFDLYSTANKKGTWECRLIEC